MIHSQKDETGEIRNRKEKSMGSQDKINPNKLSSNINGYADWTAQQQTEMQTPASTVCQFH